IKECIAHLECVVDQQIRAGDHTIFLGRVVAAYANDGVFSETFDIKKAKLVYHLGGDAFTTTSDEVVTPS
ncbi:flavin reductase, partial [Candidatus Bathyarchaeota archaeon]|nr:flavin reductase [Candidatus Bathyarchaeota archaeon]